uniref:Uncharacterized protein n=1 Tax=Arundo donax TaxID=35708 RepID=A0A0A8ZNZ4_ARUDO
MNCEMWVGTRNLVYILLLGKLWLFR